MPPAPLPEVLSAQRLEAAQAAFTKVDERLTKLKAELAKVEAARTAAETEVSAATEAHTAALAAADDRERRAKRWHPPCDAASRARALNEPDSSPLAQCWELCEGLPLPRPTDWLAKGQVGEKDRGGQTLAQFCRPGRALPSPAMHTAYLVPLGKVSGAPPIGTLLDFLRSNYSMNFQPLPSELAPSASDVAALSRAGAASAHGPMLSSTEACDLLFKHKPRDAFMLLAYTMEDLQALSASSKARTDDDAIPAGDENDEANNPTVDLSAESGAGKPQYVFGESLPMKSVGIVSFARFGEGATLVDLPDAIAFAYISRSVRTHSVFLRRCVSAVGHECGKLLGMARCVYGRCLLNGAVHLAEVDIRPLVLNPLQLKKLVSTLDDASRTGLQTIEPKPMLTRLADREARALTFLTNHGFESDAAACQARLAKFEASLGTEQAVARQQSFEHESEMAREIELVREAVRRDAEAARELQRLDAGALGAGAAGGGGGAAPRGARGQQQGNAAGGPRSAGAGAAPMRAPRGAVAPANGGGPAAAGGGGVGVDMGSLDVQAAVSFAPPVSRRGAASPRAERSASPVRARPMSPRGDRAQPAGERSASPARARPMSPRGARPVASGPAGGNAGNAASRRGAMSSR